MTIVTRWSNITVKLFHLQEHNNFGFLHIYAHEFDEGAFLVTPPKIFSPKSLVFWHEVDKIHHEWKSICPKTWISMSFLTWIRSWPTNLWIKLKRVLDPNHFWTQNFHSPPLMNHSLKGFLVSILNVSLLFLNLLKMNLTMNFVNPICLWIASIT